MTPPPASILCHSAAPDLLGESPFWHPHQQALYWVDIAGQALRRRAADGEEQRWPLGDEPGCIAPMTDGRLLIALRAGVIAFDPTSGAREMLAPAPYDTKTTRFNDGRCDPRGRFWAGTVFEPKTAAEAGLYRLTRLAAGGWTMTRHLGDNITANGLAFSLDGRQAWWSNTPEHVIHQYAFDPDSGVFGAARVFQRFARRVEGQPYGGRPDGVAIDSQGNYWVAMYEGGCVRQFDPSGAPLLTLDVPVSAPTMVCFGGPALRTLYITSASKGRPAEERARQPFAGHVLAIALDDLPVDSSLRGVPVAFFDPAA